MIICPFCGDSFKENDLVFEFNWGDTAAYYYNRRFLDTEPKAEFRDRSFYVTFRYDWRGNPHLASINSTVNPQKHSGTDPICSPSNNWPQISKLLSRNGVFAVECGDDRSLPVQAKILPLIKYSKKQHRADAEGVSTGIFCPICEQQLMPEVIRAESEIRILLCGRRGSGKTVYVTQAISELMQGRLANSFNIEPANNAVREHYRTNKDCLKAFGNSFVLANNPVVVQEPYVFLLKNNTTKASIRLVIQDIAGEDTLNRTKYSGDVRKADMLIFFIDPWHIEEMRLFHQKNEDPSNDIVNFSTNGLYTDMNGVFQQMMNVIDRRFTDENDQLAAVLLVKGDYLNPPMLSRDSSQPEFEMMRQPIAFSKPDEMEFTIGMRSSFIRQCMLEWESTRSFSRDVEGKYSAHNTRYFVASALGQSTYLRRSGDDTYDSGGADNEDDPNAQFSLGSTGGGDSFPDKRWNYEEQVLETAARPENVIDPIFWCMKRKGVKL